MKGILGQTKSSRKKAGKVNIRITECKSDFEQLVRDKVTVSDYINLKELVNLKSNREKGWLFSSPENAKLQVLCDLEKLLKIDRYILARDFSLAKNNIPPTVMEEMKNKYIENQQQQVLSQSPI